MDIADREREFLRGMRAIDINTDGEEVFVGLSSAESIEFLDLWRLNETGSLPSDAHERFHALRDRHESTRQTVVTGEAPIHHAGADGSRQTS